MLSQLLGTKNLSLQVEDAAEQTFRTAKITSAVLTVSKDQLNVLQGIHTSINQLKDVFEGSLTKTAHNRYRQFSISKDLTAFFAQDAKQREQKEEVRRAEEEENRKERDHQQKTFFERLLGSGNSSKKGSGFGLSALIDGFGKAIALAFAPIVAAFAAPGVVAGIRKFSEFFVKIMEVTGSIGEFIGTLVGGKTGGSLGSVLAQIAVAGTALLAPLVAVRGAFNLLLKPMRGLIRLLGGGAISKLLSRASTLGRGALAGLGARTAATTATSAATGVAARSGLAVAGGTAGAVAGAALAGWGIGSLLNQRSETVMNDPSKKTMLDEFNPAYRVNSAANSVVDGRGNANIALAERVARTGKYTDEDINAYAKQYEVGNWWVTDDERRGYREQTRAQFEQLASIAAKRNGNTVSSSPSDKSDVMSVLFRELYKQVTEGGIVVRIAGSVGAVNVAAGNVHRNYVEALSPKPTPSPVTSSRPDFSNVQSSVTTNQARRPFVSIPSLDAISGGSMPATNMVTDAGLSTQSYGNGNGVGGLLDYIAEGEVGTKDSSGYDVVYGGKRGAKPPKSLTQMTVGEVLDWQQARRQAGAASTAAGRYQFIYKTLKGLVEDLQISRSAKFDQALQDRLAKELLRRRGLQRYQAGKMSMDEFQLSLSKEWASIPKDGSGRSYYAGDGLNSAQHSVSETRAAIGGIKTAPAMSGSDQTSQATQRLRADDKQVRQGRASVALQMPVSHVSAPTYNNSSTGVALGSIMETQDTAYKDLVA